MTAPLLRIEGLKVRFGSRESEGVLAVDGVDLEILEGEMVGVVGETGCGKSVTAMSVLGLIPSPPGRIVAGRIVFEGEDLLQRAEGEMRRIRGARIAMIFQEPMTSLDPSFKIGSQMVEVLKTHRRLTGRAAREEARRYLERVRMPHPERVLSQYPHQLSGGMRQRVMIAMALSCEPSLLIADEPTTALDVTVQAQILSLLVELQELTGTSVLLITHDLGVVAETCDRVYVMYAGRMVETAPAGQLFTNPRHPYTRGLLEAIPRDEATRRLKAIPGTVPSPYQYPPGCRFAPRCPHVMDTCRREVPPEFSVSPSHRAACYLLDESLMTSR